MLARMECSRTLLDIFARYEEFLDQGRLAYKIAGSLLSLFLHLVSTGEVSLVLALLWLLTPRKIFQFRDGVSSYLAAVSKSCATSAIRRRRPRRKSGTGCCAAAAPS